MPETPREPATERPEPVPVSDSGSDAAEPNANGLPKRLDGRHEVQDAVPATAVARTVPGRVETALEHAKLCARIAEDNRAKDILVLDLRGATPLIDFFVIASASSRRQASSLAYEVDAEMKKLNEHKLGIEGAEEGRWTLIDYGDFIVHLFSDEARAYYGLEDIWGDAPRIDWKDPARAKAE